MKGPYFTHLYLVTLDGKHPSQTTRTPLHAQTYEEAVAEAENFARNNDRDVAEFKIFYGIDVTAHSEWAEVGENTDYVETVQAILEVSPPPRESDAD